MKAISGELALAEFRAANTGRRTLDLLKIHGGRCVLDWPIGVGKSRNIDDTIEAAVTAGDYDIVIVLVPTRRLIEERRWIHMPPPGIKIINLQPRPRKRCRKKRDAEWQAFEVHGLGLLGREQICKKCPSRRGCHWPKQYATDTLRGARVVYGTLAHLDRSPNFVDHVVRTSRAKRALVILDEGGVATRSYRRRISRQEIAQFITVLRSLEKPHSTSPGAWLSRCELLLAASTFDLQGGDWRMPDASKSWCLAVQRRGREVFGDAFRFSGHLLREFGRSPVNSRERHVSGDISFASVPFLRHDCVIYSGTTSLEFLRFRLGVQIAAPYADTHFSHPETKWYNLASRLGTAGFFRNNADQLLDFFAALIFQRIREGRRPLLISKMRFVNYCAEEMTRRLRSLGVDDVQIMTSGWAPAELVRPNVIPLIHYGVIGTNLFEHFDCAFCLNSYYVRKEVVDGIVQDLLPSDMQIPTRIRTGGTPRRRTVEALRENDRYFDVPHLTQLALDELEIGTVIQAVGRVRPFTRPREIFTFQCASSTAATYYREFHTLAQARKFFGIPNRRERRRAALVVAILNLKARGLKQVDVAADLNVSVRTIRRYWSQ